MMGMPPSLTPVLDALYWTRHTSRVVTTASGNTAPFLEFLIPDRMPSGSSARAIASDRLRSPPIHLRNFGAPWPSYQAAVGTKQRRCCAQPVPALKQTISSSRNRVARSACTKSGSACTKEWQYAPFHIRTEAVKQSLETDLQVVARYSGAEVNGCCLHRLQNPVMRHPSRQI